MQPTHDPSQLFCNPRQSRRRRRHYIILSKEITTPSRDGEEMRSFVCRQIGNLLIFPPRSQAEKYARSQLRRLCISSAFEVEIAKMHYLRDSTGEFSSCYSSCYQRSPRLDAGFLFNPEVITVKLRL